MMGEVKQCRYCGEDKPLSNFRSRHKCRSCQRRAYQRGNFTPDYSRARKHIRDRVAVVDRGYSTPCWIWQRATEERGYGRTAVTGYSRRLVHVHRAAMETFRGPIPAGFEVDHLCRVPSCVNPAHLEAVTPDENRQRRISAEREKRAAAKLPSGLGERAAQLLQRPSITHTQSSHSDRTSERRT